MMAGAQAIVVVTAMLLVHSANCRPLSFPRPQSSDTLGGSHFPNYDVSDVPQFPNPFPTYDQFDYLDDLYSPLAQSRDRAMTQVRGQERQMASDEAFKRLRRFGKKILKYLLNKFRNKNCNPRSMDTAPAAVNRRPAHTQQDLDDIEILTDILSDELVGDYQNFMDGEPDTSALLDLNGATEQATKQVRCQIVNIRSYVRIFLFGVAT